MKKITMSLLTMSLLTIGASANEILTDSFGNSHNIGLTVGMEHIAKPSVNLYKVGVNDRIDSVNCNLDLYVNADMAFVPTQGEVSNATFVNIGGGVITPSISIWNNKVEMYAGLQLQNEFNSTPSNAVIVNLQPEIGLIINDRLTVGYKQYETDLGNSSTLNISYKF